MAVKGNWVVRTLATLALAAFVSGCATGARTGAMTVPVTPDLIVADASPLHSAFRVGTVSGGSDTNPLWKSNVSDAIRSCKRNGVIAFLNADRWDRPGDVPVVFINRLSVS